MDTKTIQVRFSSKYLMLTKKMPSITMGSYNNEFSSPIDHVIIKYFIYVSPTLSIVIFAFGIFSKSDYHITKTI